MERWLPRVWPLVLAFLVLAPLLTPGYVLSYDMVFVPDQDLRADFFGLRSTLPRAVPSDALVALASVALPGQVIQKVVLVGILVGAGLGMATLTRDAPLVARLVATSAYVWNPYVAERLLLGQWAVLAGLAALPWVVVAALTVRRGRTAGWAWSVLAIAVASLSPSGGVTAVGVAALVVCWPGTLATRRDVLLTTLGGGAVNAPWIALGALTASRAVTSAAAVEAFAARSEGHLPVLGTVLSLGGAWNAETVPDSRLTWVPVGWLVVLLVVAGLGVRGLRAHLGRSATWALTVAAGASLVLALLGSLSPVVLATVMDGLPGAALFRDGTRYLGPLVLLEALLLGFGAVWLLSRVPSRGVRLPLALACVVAPLAVLPDLAWGAEGRLEPVDYPAAWAEARAAMAQDGRPGDALVLPPSPYRAYDWNDGRSGLDPAGRYFPVITRTSEALVVNGEVVQEEDPAIARAAALYADGDLAGLGQEGVGFVVVDASLADEVAAAQARGLDPIFLSDEVAVLGVPGSEESAASRARFVVAVIGWLLALSVLVAAAVTLVRGRDPGHIERRGHAR